MDYLIWWDSLTDKQKSEMTYKHYTFSVDRVKEYEIEMIYEYEI